MKKALLTLIIVVCFLCVVCGCDDGLKIVGMEISHYPNRIVYVKGVDHKVDLTGGKVNILLKDGDKVELSLDDQYILEGDILVGDNIDFSKPGIYKVMLTRYTESCEFPVQVIDKDYIAKAEAQ